VLLLYRVDFMLQFNTKCSVTASSAVFSPHVPEGHSMDAMKRIRRRPRRAAVMVAAIAVGAGMLAGCAADDATPDSTSEALPDGGVTIDFWGWVPGLEDLVAQWNDVNPD